MLWLRPEGGAPFAVPRKDVQWPERWSARRTPETLSIDLGPHGSLQVHDPAAWQAALAAAGGRPTLAEKMQTRWPALLSMLLLVGTGLWTPNMSMLSEISTFTLFFSSKSLMFALR